MRGSSHKSLRSASLAMANCLQNLFFTCCSRSKAMQLPEESQCCRGKQERLQSCAVETRTTLTSMGTGRVPKEEPSAAPLKHSFTNLDEASSHLRTPHLEHLKCAFCSQDATGFCVGCTAVRYCRDCYKPEHERKSGLHMFCSYSNTIPTVLARFQANNTARSDTESV